MPSIPASNAKKSLPQKHMHAVSAQMPKILWHFLRVAKFALLTIGSTLFGSRWAEKRKNDKKGELATVLAHAVATADSGRFTPEQSAKLKRWLPEGMSFALPEPETAEPARVEALAA